MKDIKIWHIILAALFLIAVTLGILRYEPTLSPSRYSNPDFQRTEQP